MVAFSTLWFALAWIKYRYYLYTDFDLAIFTQAVSGLLRGSLDCSIRGTPWLGDHSSLNLFLVAPLYALLPSPLTLLALQSFALALGALPLWHLARLRLGSEGLALGCAALYLLQPALGFMGLFEFHPEMLSVPALIAALYYLEIRRVKPMALWTGVALLGKEDVAAVVLGLAIYAGLRWRRAGVRDGLLLGGLAVGSLLISFLVLKPMFSTGAAEYALMYRTWGSSAAEIAGNLVREPWRALGALVDSPGDPSDAILKREYYVHLLLPVLGLPLVSPGLALAALPIVFEHFLSSRPPQHTIAYHYAALVIPCWSVAMVHGLARVMGHRGGARGVSRAAGRRGALVVTTAFGAAILSHVLFGPLSPLRAFQHHHASERPWPNVADRTWRPYRDRMVGRIPGRGGVIASFEYLARLASRDSLHSFHHAYQGHYTMSNRPFPTPQGIVAMLTRLGDQWDPESQARIDEVVRRNALHPVDAAGDLVLCLRDAPTALDLLDTPSVEPARPAHLIYEGELEYRGCTLPDTVVATGGLIEIDTFWQKVAPLDQAFLTEFSLYDSEQNEIGRVSRYLGYATGEIGQVPVGSVFRERYRMLVPLGAAPGRRQLVLRVLRRTAREVSMATPNDPVLAGIGGWFVLGSLEIRSGPPWWKTRS